MAEGEGGVRGGKMAYLCTDTYTDCQQEVQNGELNAGTLTDDAATTVLNAINKTHAVNGRRYRRVFIDGSPDSTPRTLARLSARVKANPDQSKTRKRRALAWKEPN